MVSGVAGQLSCSISSDDMLPSSDGVALVAGTCRLREAIEESALWDGARSCAGVGGASDKALLSLSMVGHAEGDGMMMEGYRFRLDRATFFTEAEHLRGTSASSSVMSYKESQSLSALLSRCCADESSY